MPFFHADAVVLVGQYCLSLLSLLIHVDSEAHSQMGTCLNVSLAELEKNFHPPPIFTAMYKLRVIDFFDLNFV